MSENPLDDGALGHERHDPHAAAATIADERVDLVPPDTFLSREVGAGEAQAIALASRERDATLLLDERIGRRIASLAYGLRVRGTVGTLALAKRRALCFDVGLALAARRAGIRVLGARA